MITSARSSHAFLRQMRIPVLVTSIAALFAFAVPAIQSAKAPRRDASGVRTILFFGDSLTDGYGLSRSQAYPAVIAEKLRTSGQRYEVINAGVSGDTTSGGLRRIARYLDQKIDVFVLELGINDAFRGVPVPQMRENLQSIIDRVRKANPNVAIVIAGMQLPLYGADEYVQTFGAMYTELAEKNNAALVPYLLLGVGGNPSLNLGDRVHPNAAGQRILAENVWRVLEPVLQKATAAPAAHVD
jgi:acyl-CoA thioesterase-1